MATTLISNGKVRQTSAELTIHNGQFLTFSLTSDAIIPNNMRQFKIERKNSENIFKPYSLNDGIFCYLDYDATEVTISVPGTYRIIRPDITNFDVNVGVEYSVSYDSLDINQPLTFTRSNKDVNGIFTTIDYHRVDGSLAKRSVLSGGTSPEYTTRTETWFESDGVTEAYQTIYSLSYDEDGALISEILDSEILE